jgi:hypothetical protein
MGLKAGLIQKTPINANDLQLSRHLPIDSDTISSSNSSVSQASPKMVNKSRLKSGEAGNGNTIELRWAPPIYISKTTLDKEMKRMPGIDDFEIVDPMMAPVSPGKASRRVRYPIRAAEVVPVEWEEKLGQEIFTDNLA